MKRIVPRHRSSRIAVRKPLQHVDPLLVQRLAQRLECRKPGHVMEALGISLNTWKKLEDGAPIRPSVAARLLDRFAALASERQ